MSQKQRKLSSKKKQNVNEHEKAPFTHSTSLSSHESSSSSSEFANISIKIYNFDNLQYLFDDNSQEEFEIIAKYLSIKIIPNNNETRFGASIKNSLAITFNIQVDVNREEEIFNLCANPVLLSLLKHSKEEGVIVMGNCNIDMLTLCTPHVETRTFQKLHFERELSHFRKFSFDCMLSSDIPILKASYGNMMNITINSLHDYDVKGGDIIFGFQAPMNCQV